MINEIQRKLLACFRTDHIPHHSKNVVNVNDTAMKHFGSRFFCLKKCFFCSSLLSHDKSFNYVWYFQPLMMYIRVSVRISHSQMEFVQIAWSVAKSYTHTIFHAYYSKSKWFCVFDCIIFLPLFRSNAKGAHIFGIAHVLHVPYAILRKTVDSKWSIDCSSALNGTSIRLSHTFGHFNNETVTDADYCSYTR